MHGTDVVELVVSDDGAGLPPGFDPEESDSLGLRLVSALVDQLDGEADVQSRPGRGVRWEIRFPLRPRAPSMEDVADDG